MPKKAKERVQCEYFAWTIFRRDDVYYADGRGGTYNIGKQSLGTKSHAEALERLRALDRHMAVQLGLAAPENKQSSADIGISDGWQDYLDHTGRSPVLGGASQGTVKRYRAVRDKHVKFCGNPPEPSGKAKYSFVTDSEPVP